VVNQVLDGASLIAAPPQVRSRLCQLWINRQGLAIIIDGCIHIVALLRRYAFAKVVIRFG